MRRTTERQDPMAHARMVDQLLVDGPITSRVVTADPCPSPTGSPTTACSWPPTSWQLAGS